MAYAGYSKWRSAEARQALNQTFTPQQVSALQIAVPDMQTAYVGTAVTISASTTLAAVTDLSVPVESNTRYLVRASLDVLADVNGGTKIDFSAGTCSANTFGGFAELKTASAIAVVTATALNTALGATALTLGVTFTGYIHVNVGGTLQIKAAQNAASGTTVIAVGSFLQVTRIP
jgi:hypothetical protein